MTSHRAVRPDRTAAASAPSPSRITAGGVRVACACLLLALPACGDGTGPGTTYTLTTVGGQALPVPMVAGSLILVHGGRVTLGPGDRVVNVLDLRCADPLPSGSTCAVSPGGARNEGTYSAEDGTVTFASVVLPATFAPDEVVIRSPGEYVSGIYSRAWIYRR